jgi:hypothetical protein
MRVEKTLMQTRASQLSSTRMQLLFSLDREWELRKQGKIVNFLSHTRESKLTCEEKVFKENVPVCRGLKMFCAEATNLQRKASSLTAWLELDFPKSAVRGSWKRRTFVTRKRAKFTGAFLLRWHYYSALTTPFDMVNAHYVIIDFRAKFFNKIQNQASDTSRSLPSFSSAPFLLRAVPSERLGQV